MAPTNVNKKKVSTHIPDDLEISILSKLPIKSLKRFGCARKSWSNFFENPNFVKSFASSNCSPPDDTCVLLSQVMPTPSHPGPHCLDLLYGEKFENKLNLYLPLRFHENLMLEPPLHISGSVNGIICLLDVQYETRILWNTVTKECLHIPPSPSQVIASNFTMSNLDGFGYDHVRDDYKVIQCVGISRYNPNTNVEVEARLAYVPTGPGPLWEIYSLKSNSWRKLDVNVHQKLGCSEVYLNGMCHWLGGIQEEPLVVDEPPAVTCVVSFNFSSEVFITTPSLFDMHDDDDDNFKLPKRRLVVLYESIAMISKYSTTASFHISILGELGVEGSWVKLFIVGPLPFFRHPIGAGKNGEMFFRTKDDDLVCFDLNTQSFEEVGPKGVASRQTTIYKMNLSPFILSL